jgi:Na+-translocating ferredoxin:NAD+ oxidoreductase RNF subunit RnfB
MPNSVLHSILLLTSLGGIAAIILYMVSKKFYVFENPLIAEIDELLPAANCGGCGSPGCKAFAEKLVNTEDIADLFCPVGGTLPQSSVCNLFTKITRYNLNCSTSQIFF